MHLRSVGRGLHEDQIGAGLPVEPAPGDGLVQAVDRQGVGARHDHQIRVPSGVQGRLELLQEVPGRHYVLAGHVAAALGKDLVLNEQPGDPGLLEAPHHARHIGGVAETGVAVDEDRQAGRLDDPAVVVGHLGHGELGGVRRSQERGGGAVAAAGHGLETGGLDDPGDQGVVGHGHDQDLRRLDQLAESRGGLDGGLPVMWRALVARAAWAW
jgi:hypothetical protein